MPEILSDNGHSCCHLDSLNVLGLPALRALGHLELHLLTFLQAAKAASLNCGEMHEHILPILTAQPWSRSHRKKRIIRSSLHWSQEKCGAGVPPIPALKPSG